MTVLKLPKVVMPTSLSKFKNKHSSTTRVSAVSIHIVILCISISHKPHCTHSVRYCTIKANLAKLSFKSFVWFVIFAFLHISSAYFQNSESFEPAQNAVLT